MMNKNLRIKDTLRLYWGEMKHHKSSFFLMLTLIPIGALIIDTALPYALSQAVGELSDGNQAAVKEILLVAAGIGLLGAVLNFIGFQAMVFHESKVINRLRQSVFEKLINKDLSFFSDNKVGAMTSRYIDFVRAQMQVQDLLIIRTLGFILSVGSGLVLLAMHSLLIAAVVGGFIALLALQIRWSMWMRRNWRHERKNLVSDIHGSVADSLTNNLIVKTFAGEKNEIHTLQKLTQRFGTLYRKDIGFALGEGSVRVALMIIIQIIGVTIATNMVFDGTLSIAIAIFILAYMQRIGSQLFVLGDILNGFDQAFLDADPMTAMLLQSNKVEDTKGAYKLKEFEPSITFQDVSFKYYDSETHVMQHLQLEIKAGEKIGLIGPSGAGKTTISQLILRFHDVTNGKILIGTHNIMDITQESLRQHIAYVPQEPMLFHRTLKENISYGKPDATLAEITDAARKAHALEFIEKMPLGLETLVGERGIKLSGGQRQRIAIARAILKDAPILVLDEATSALDSESEKLIQDSLSELMKHRTTIVIAHRLSTIQKMDRIIVLNDGDISEQGSHSVLLAKKGIYAKLWAHQSGGFIDE